MRKLICLSLLLSGCDAIVIEDNHTRLGQIREKLTGVAKTQDEQFAAIRSKLDDHTDRLERIKANTEPQPAAVEGGDASQPNQSLPPAPVVDPLNDTPPQTEDGPPPPKETQNAKRPWTSAHYRLIDYSADWCEPCRRWAKNERDQISCKVEVHDIGTNPVSDVNTVPTLQLERWNGSNWQRVKRWIGYTPATVINGAVESDIAAKNGATSTGPKYGGVVGATSPSGANRFQTQTKIITERVPVTKTVRVKVPGSGWNEGRTACGNPGCSMCYSQYQNQTQTVWETRQRTIEVPVEIQADTSEAGQQPCPDAEIDAALQSLNLTPSDKLVDLGCGDGRVLIAAVEQYDCSAVGVEIDPVMADRARARIEAAGLSDRIEIITGDVLDFNPLRHGVTKAYAFLYGDLLEQLQSTFQTIGVAVSPFHPMPGLQSRKVGNVYLYGGDV